MQISAKPTLNVPSSPIPAAKPSKPVETAKSNYAMEAERAEKTEGGLAGKNNPMETAKPSNMAAIHEQRSSFAPKSYVMVISSYENVARNQELTSKAADQLGKTIDGRIKELNKSTLREIQELPEYKKLGIDDINDLGDEIADLMTDEDDYRKAFDLLKSPAFVDLMESKEGVHRSFAEMMQANGSERLMFGALDSLAGMKSPVPPSNLSVKA